MANERTGTDWWGRLGGLCGMFSLVWTVLSGSATYIAGNSAFLTVDDQIVRANRVEGDVALEINERYKNVGNNTASNVRGAMMVVSATDDLYAAKMFYENYCPDWHLFPNSRPIYKGMSSGVNWSTSTELQLSPSYLRPGDPSGPNDVHYLAIRCVSYSTGVPFHQNQEKRVYGIEGCTKGVCEDITVGNKTKAFASYELVESLQDLFEGGN